MRDLSASLRQNVQLFRKCEHRGDIIKIRAEVNTAEQLEQVLENDDYEFIYAPLGLLGADTPDKFRIIALPPLYLADCEERVSERLSELEKQGFKHALAHTAGHTELIKRAGMTVHGGFHLNITNSRAVLFYEHNGMSDIMLSQEITLKRAEKIVHNAPVGIIAYGRQSLMTLRRCPINNGKPCNSGKSCGGELTDRMGNKMPLMCGGTVEVLNPDLLILSDKMSELAFLDFIVLRFTTEHNTDAVFRMYMNGRKPEGRLTRGLYYRGVE